MNLNKSEVIAMWSGPRNVSTALMYSFNQREDTQVYDEPFFGFFLKHTGVWRPSREEVLETMELDLSSIFDQFDSEKNKDFLFLKNMANHVEGMDLNKLQSFKNIILVRHPLKVLKSYSKHIESPSALDLGYYHQTKILDFLKSKGLPSLIVNSDDVCEFPEKQLRRICAYLEIEFSQSMLSWEKGPIPEDGCWAKYWYHNVHQSEGFSASSSKPQSLKPELNEIYNESLNYYQKILNDYE